MPEPSHDPQFHWQWFHASPLLLLWFKRIRRLIIFWVKEDEKEDAESNKIVQPVIPANVITREEIEPRLAGLKEDMVNMGAGLKDDMNMMHQDISEKLMANAAQARQDNRDLRTEVRNAHAEMFQKIDGFMTQVTLNQRGK